MIVLINMVTILATVGLFKTKTFLDKGYDVIIFVLEVFINRFVT